LSDWVARRKTRQEGAPYECNQYLPRFAYRAPGDPVDALDAKAETTDHRVSITKDVPVLRIDHSSIKGKLLGVWQAFYSGSVFEFREMKPAPLAMFPQSFSTFN